ncbi:MAG: Ig-like domain repeat protein, partial [Nocardioides sp.]
WNINAGESVAMEYSRYNYHSTDFHQDGPFRSSDHDPVVVGLAGVSDPVTVSTTTSATAQPMTYGTDGSIEVSVTPETASGPVEVTEGATSVASGTVTDGTGTVTLDGEALEPGLHTLTVRYAGNATHDPSQTTVTIKVRKAASRVSVDHKPHRVKAGKTRAKVTIRVRADGGTPSGVVVVKVPGQHNQRARLTGNGKADVRLDAFGRPGRKVLTVVYLGDDTNRGASTKHVIKVVRGKRR